VHVLPFLEATSDGGFVISNHAHRAFYGDWHDPVRLGEGRTRMAELVFNRVSASYRWVQDFRRDASPGRHMVLARPSEKDGTKWFAHAARRCPHGWEPFVAQESYGPPSGRTRWISTGATLAVLVELVAQTGSS